MAKFEPGQLIRFTYRHLVIDEASGDRFKEVLVLHPNWQGKLHGIDLKRLTMAEREVLHAIMDPETKKRPHRISLVNDIVRRMDPLDEIKNPMTFYSKFVKVFLRNKDAYRTYWPERMLHPIILKNTNVKGEVFNPKPLFHKVESKQSPEQLKAQRRELIKKSAEKQKSKYAYDPADWKDIIGDED